MSKKAEGKCIKQLYEYIGKLKIMQNLSQDVNMEFNEQDIFT